MAAGYVESASRSTWLPGYGSHLLAARRVPGGNDRGRGNRARYDPPYEPFPAQPGRGRRTGACPARKHLAAAVTAQTPASTRDQAGAARSAAFSAARATAGSARGPRSRHADVHPLLTAGRNLTAIAAELGLAATPCAAPSFLRNGKITVWKLASAPPYFLSVPARKVVTGPEGER